MMISPAGGDPYAAAAALDRQLRSPSNSNDSPSDNGASPDAGPDVVVTLSQGTASSPASYGPPGRFSGRPSLEDMGANASDSLVHATESSDDDDSSSAASTSTGDGSADASVDEDATVAA